MIKESFPLRILSITFIILAIPLLVVSLHFFQRSYEENIQRAKVDLREIANAHAFSLYNIKYVGSKILKEAVYILNQPEQDKTQRGLSIKLEELALSTNEVDFFLVQQRSGASFEIIGSNVVSSIGNVIISYKRFPMLLAGQQNRFFFYEISEQSGHYIPYIYMGEVFELGGKGGQLSILLARHDAEEILNKIVSVESIKSNKTIPFAEFAVVQADGIIIAATHSSIVGNYFNPLSEERRQQLLERERSTAIGNIKLAQDSLPLIGEYKESSFFQFIYNGRLQLAYRAPVPTMNASVIIYLSKSLFFAHEVGFFFLIYLFYGAIFIFGAIFTYVLTLWLSRPLAQLSYVMKEASQGNLGARFVSERFGYEINFLGNAFNSTLEALLENMQQLEDERVQKEAYEREIKVGHTVQRNLFPPPMKPIDEVEIKAYYHFAEEVGGDFYDYAVIEGKEGKEISLTIADASGKGISSCLYALSVRSFIRSAATLYHEVGEILTTANNAFLEDTSNTGMFVTVLMGIYDPKRSLLTYYSCGHVPGLVKRKGGEVLVLEHTGMAMGLMEVKSLEEKSIKLEAGDLVLFYTSGLIDVTNDRGVIFSEKRLIKSLKSNDWETPNEMIEGIMKLVTNFAKGGVLEEEITLLVMKVNQ